MLILVINPGSTSTKVAVYHDEQPVFSHDILHSQEELNGFSGVMAQQDYRREAILEVLRQQNAPLAFNAIVARGGLSRAVESGVYEVNDVMLEEIRNVKHKHACDLGCLIAHDIALLVNKNHFGGLPTCKAYIADPGCVDEMAQEAHVSGLPELPRICIWHALNQKAICRRFASEQGKKYEEMNLIVCHLGGGISIAAHDHGRAVDANNALDGEGPFSPERTGSLPAKALVDLCFSGNYSQVQINNLIAGGGGLVAHLGTNNMQEIERRVQQGDEHAQSIVEAMLWHIAKAICSEGAVLCGQVDAILLTGGMSHSTLVVEGLKKRIAWLAPVHVYAGQQEMQALAENALAVLRGERQAKCFL